MLLTLKHKFIMALTRMMMKSSPGSSHMLFAGDGSARQLCLHMARCGLRRVLVVTDKPLVELGLAARAYAGLEEAGVEVVLFDGVLPDPTFQIVEEGLAAYRSGNCDGILAIGGGSSIDAAKVIAAAVTNPGDPQSYIGFGKVKEQPAPLYVVPTTSGTGSEATAGAVVSDTVTHEKSIIAALGLLPLAAALDPPLTVGMPPHITAATGMDALTHAIEAYIGKFDRGDCNERAEQAIRIIFDTLPKAYTDGNDIAAREAMAHAAYQAGQAINQVNVGNVHAIAHQLGAVYGIPHGQANAMVLPHVLDMSLEAARDRLTELARVIGRDSAEDFISAVRELNAAVGIPATAEKLQAQDFATIVERAVNEGCAYGVPYLMRPADVTGILRKLLPQGNSGVGGEVNEAA
jgi:alcohol dehydrogenase class IV